MATLKFKKSKGFTIIELMVVIAILGILAAIALVKYQDSTATARGARILGDLQAIDYSINVARTLRGIDIPNGEVTAVLPAELIPEFLAFGPTPIYGNTVINGGSPFSVPAGTKYNVTSQRATINNKTIEQVLADKSI